MEYAVIAVVVVVLLISGFYWSRQRRRQAFENNARERIAKLQHMAETHKSHEPDDTDLDPAVEYMNARRPMDGGRYDLVIFASGGIIEKRLDLSEDDLDRFAKAGNWIRTSDRYHGGADGMSYTRRFERRRQ